MYNKYEITLPMMNRIPQYIDCIEEALENGKKTISATIIAKETGLGEVLVRKELSTVSGKGKAKIGYRVDSLLKDFSKFFHANKNTKAIIVGAGKLGRTLLGHKKFKDYGVDVIAAFDIDADIIDNKKIFPMSKLKKFVKANKVQIGILTVPKESAIEAYNALVDSGVKGVWNFTQVVFKSNDKVTVKQENIAISLAYLNLKIKSREPLKRSI